MRLQLLGGFGLSDAAGHETAVPLKRGRALLAYLAVRHGRAESRETLADLLWPERFKNQAQSSLRQTLHALGATGPRAVGKLVAATRTDVTLGDAVTQCDLWDLERLARSQRLSDLAQAAALHRGPLLDGLSIRAEPFHEWLLVQRVRCEELLEDSQLRAATLAADRGGAGQAIAILERLLEAKPHSERAALALMRAHAAAGQPQRGRAAFEAFRLRLKIELEVEPSEELAAAYADLRRPGPGAHVRAPAAEPKPAPVVRPAGRTREGVPMLAVMPFRDIRQFAADAPLAAALTEDVLITLSRCRWFRVMSRSSVYRLVAADARDPGDLVARAGVDYLVSGYLTDRPEVSSLTIELARAATGEILWSDRYPLASGEVPPWCGEICAAVVSALDPALSAIERQRFAQPTLASSNSAAAYRRLVEGYGHYYAGRRDAAMAAFRAAVDADPEYAHAHAMLGLTTYFYSQMNRDRAWPDRLAEAERHALNAVDLDDQEARAWQTLGTVYIWQGRNDEALAALERALELNPSLGLASAARSFQALASGAFERAKDMLRISMRLRIGDRLLGACLPAKALADLHLGNDDEALDTAHWAMRLQPRFWLARQALAASLARKGRSEAVAQVASLRRDFAGLSAGEFAAWVPYQDRRHARPVAEALAAAGWR